MRIRRIERDWWIIGDGTDEACGEPYKFEEDAEFDLFWHEVLARNEQTQPL